MKKILFVICILFCTFFLVERILRHIERVQCNNIIKKSFEKTGKPANTLIAYNDNTFDYYNDKVNFHFRKPSIYKEEFLLEFNKKPAPIIVSGCSFVHGANLMYKDTFGKILSDFTGRNVYNFAIDGGSPREFLYILRNKNIVDDLINPKTEKPIEYIIYVFIPDQLPRLYCNLYKISPAFKLNKKNNQLNFYKQKIFFSGRRFILFYKLQTFFVYKFITKDKSSRLFSIYMKECYKEIKKIWGDETKFVILLYDTKNYNWENILKLRDENIIVININELVNVDLSQPEYMSWDDLHPNRKAWDVIVPALSKRLSLNESR